MAENLKDIRRRIRSVENMERVTGAMKMVAASQLRRAQARAQAARPYAVKIREVLESVAASAGDLRHPLLLPRAGNRSVVLLVTGDRGLAGPYNSNIIRAAEAHLRTHESRAVIAVGRKGRDYFRRRRYDILAEFVAIGDEASWSLAQQIGEEAMRLYAEGAADEIAIAYAQFVNTVVSRPVVQRLLPLAGQERDAAASKQMYLFEPEAGAVLARLLPHYVYTLVYRALLEGKASEHGARMTAMDNASKNARDIIGRLTLQRNRVRQAAITKEIAEIVGGANALAAEGAD